MLNELATINHPNAPHYVLVTMDVRACELKNTGEMVPVTKNRPFIVKKRFNNLEEAKVFEAEGIKMMLELEQELKDAKFDDIKENIQLNIPENGENNAT